MFESWNDGRGQGPKAPHPLLLVGKAASNYLELNGVELLPARDGPTTECDVSVLYRMPGQEQHPFGEINCRFVNLDDDDSILTM